MATKTPSKTTSIRTNKVVHDRARARADREGYNLNQVINALLEGYARGVLDMPRLQFQAPRPGKPMPDNPQA